MAATSKVSLESHIDGNHPIRCDKDRVQQVLTNLVSNAIKFSPSGSEIVVSCHTEPGATKFAVTDQGPGIPSDKLPRLFNKFEQLDTSTSSYSGSGLGLAIAKAIVEQHGGTIGVDSEVGKGTTFWFVLPERSISQKLLRSGTAQSET